MNSLLQRLPVFTALYLQKQEHKLDLYKQAIDAASPSRVLAMGYSITRVNGKAVRSLVDVPAGTRVETTVEGGSFTSVVDENK